MNVTTWQEFRQEVNACFGKATDALFNIDVLD
jgi:hypothetical protein